MQWGMKARLPSGWSRHLGRESEAAGRWGCLLCPQSGQVGPPASAFLCRSFVLLPTVLGPAGLSDRTFLHSAFILLAPSFPSLLV